VKFMGISEIFEEFTCKVMSMLSFSLHEIL
jgi:hypothetical protein